MVDLIKHSGDELRLVGTKNKKFFFFLFDTFQFFFKLLPQLVKKHIVIYIQVKNQVEVQMTTAKDVHWQLQYQIIVC